MNMLKTPKDLYPRLIADIHRTIADDNARQQIQYRWVIKILVLFSVILAAVNLIIGNYPIGLLMIFSAACFFADYWIVFLRKRAGVIPASIAIIVQAFVLFTVLIIRGEGSGFSSIWVLIMPAVSVILVGSRIALFANIMMLIELIFLLWTPWGYALLQYPYSHALRVRLPLLYLLLYLITVFTNLLRVITVQELRASRDRMEAVYQRQYSSMHSRIQEARRTRHDMRHHFIIIDQLLYEGQLDELRSYIHEYYEALPYEEALIYCQHYGTNALLTYCAQRAKAENIPKKIHVDYPAELPFPDSDLTVIFGNLLENALEASLEGIKRDAAFSPAIWVDGYFNKNVLYFSVRNRSNHTAVMDSSGSYVSSKHAGHGIGISSVKGIVQKYDGTFDIEQDDGEFLAECYLKVPAAET